jgi:multiple sugar transport system permease protein
VDLHLVHLHIYYYLYDPAEEAAKKQLKGEPKLSKAEPAITRPWRARIFQAKPSELIPPFYLWIGIIFLSIFTLLPFLYLMISSISQSQELLSGHLFPHVPTIKNYIKLFQGNTGKDFVHAMENSLSVSIWTTAVTIFIGVFSAYALARVHFPFRFSLLFIILAMQLLPSISIIVPLYIMMREGIAISIPFTSVELVHTRPLLDSNAALIIANVATSLPFAIMLLNGYFQSISKEMEEAAYMDGCSKLRTMFKIVLPLALPGIAATAIFTFLNTWDEFMFASAFSQTYASKTLPVAVREFIGKHSIDWGLMTAGGFIASLPPVLVSLFLYRYIVSGLSEGGIKE